MFASLSERFDGIVKNLTGRGRLTEENIKETLRAIRIALLEADVALPVVKSFIQRVQEKALGEKVLNSLTPGQELTKIVKDELTLILGEATAELTLSKMPPTVILVAGLQGAGKTTTVVKLARFLKEQGKKKVLVTSTDIYRPAAIEQLATLAKQTEIEYFPSSTNQDPLSIAQHAIQEARKLSCDIVIIDTAGRLHVDNEMMQEIKKLHAGVQPTETLFVVDSMTGQDAVHTANAFNDALPLTGVVLTKTDGDARGGAALSVWETIHKPIKFIGTGEKIDQFEIFHPERIATRILGMGDIVSLVEDVHQKIDQKKAEKVAKKLKSGKRF
ncbi:MAG: signal recognition particle protein Srp54, partial [Gammaproteobacteria bacterium]|nr:signal recognition particle protein Srp54 [Gammaproteobacteria bacterium]